MFLYVINGKKIFSDVLWENVQYDALYIFLPFGLRKITYRNLLNIPILYNLANILLGGNLEVDHVDNYEPIVGVQYRSEVTQEDKHNYFEDMLTKTQLYPDNKLYELIYSVRDYYGE